MYNFITAILDNVRVLFSTKGEVCHEISLYRLSAIFANDGSAGTAALKKL